LHYESLEDSWEKHYEKYGNSSYEDILKQIVTVILKIFMVHKYRSIKIANETRKFNLNYVTP